MDNYSKISSMLAYQGFFVMIMEQQVDIMVPDDPRIHFANFSDVNLIPASVIPQALQWIQDEYTADTVPMLPCAPPNQDSVALLGHALGARAVRPCSPSFIVAAAISGRVLRQIRHHFVTPSVQCPSMPHSRRVYLPSDLHFSTLFTFTFTYPQQKLSIPCMQCHTACRPEYDQDSTESGVSCRQRRCCTCISPPT